MSYLTPLREQLLEIFKSSDTCISFEKLSILLQEANLKCNKSTIYRQLRDLEKIDLIKSQAVNGVLVWSKSAENNHQHMICISCSKVVCFHFDKALLQTINNTFSFKIFNIQLTGQCANCLV